MPLIRFFAQIFYDAVLQFSADDGWAIASHIALTILTSLFPFLIFVTALAGFIGTNHLAEEAVVILFDTWPKQVAEPLANEVRNVLTETRGGLLTLGVVLALYFSSSGVEALRIGLNRAYDAKDARPWIFLRMESIAFVLVGAIGLLALAFVVILAPWFSTLVLSLFPELAPLQALFTPARFAIATAILFLALVLAHKFLPAGHRGLSDTLPGIFFTLLCWMAEGIAFGYYLSEFARNYVTTYAGLASVMIAILFLYTTASIFIFGGELNAAILRRRSHRKKTDAASGCA